MRRGFTLVELLIVIGVIAVLAGLLFPALGLVRRQVNGVKCASNLKQIATGIEVYRQDHNEIWPGSLRELWDRTKCDYFEPGSEKILFCPLDASRGTTNSFNRPPSYGELFDIYANERGPVSYQYECSAVVLLSGTPGTPGTPHNNGWVSWFSYVDGGHPLADGSTWAEGKTNQKQFGNLGPNGEDAPFAAEVMPAIRCWWHHPWSGGASDRMRTRVQNVSWGSNVFWSTPYWESDANPAIPRGN